MTILWAGGEDINFTLIGATVTTNASYFRSAFARAAIGSANTTAYAVTPSWGPANSFWVHAQTGVQAAATNPMTSGGTFLALLDSAGVERIILRYGAYSGAGETFTICTGNAAGTVTPIATSTAGALPAAAVVPVSAIDIFCNYSTTGQVEVYVNGVLVCNTGAGVNVTTDGQTQLTALLLSAGFSGFSPSQSWSEVIVASTSTLGWALQTLPPVAAGATQSWTGVVGSINEATNNTGAFIDTASTNALSEWTVAGTLPTGNWTIAAVAQAASVSAGASGPQHFAWDVHTSAGSFQNGSVAPPVGSFGNFQNILPVNPATAAPWTAGQLLNSGLESLA
jgi:hypothetical protein